MFKKKKRQSIKFFTFFIGVFLLFIGMFLLTTHHQNYTKIEKTFHDIGNGITSIFIPKNKEYSDNLINGINRELEEENQELKKILALNSSEYQFIYADVIDRKIDWYQEITINKGEKDGIKIDMAVISTQGLVGRIVKTGYSSSVVKLLTANSNDMKIAVDIKNQEESIHGIIDDYLEQDELLLVNHISKNSDIQVEDKVYTNGLGGIYPSGIYIGQVVEVTYDSLGLNKIAKVKTDTSYDVLRYVSVVNKKVEE